MLEAVNSVLSNASYTKAVADQQSVVNSYAANPDRVQQVSQQAPYLSLYIKMDVNFDKAILQMRDNESGDVLRQIPSESQLEAYRRAQTSNAVRPATIEEEDTVEISTPDYQPAQTDAAPVPEQTVSAPAPQPQSTDIQV
jgi:uncharacterized FlaG/YvyC family protein